MVFEKVIIKKLRVNTDLRSSRGGIGKSAKRAKGAETHQFDSLWLGVYMRGEHQVQHAPWHFTELQFYSSRCARTERIIWTTSCDVWENIQGNNSSEKKKDQLVNIKSTVLPFTLTT